MKKYKKIIIFLIFIFLFLIEIKYNYYLRPLVDDELYNYGFAKNILDGKIPYLDYNMIITPFFPYLLSIILKIFGQKLLVYHIFLSLIITTITYICYKKIGLRSIAIYSLCLIYPFIGYNTFSLLLLIILINLEKIPNHKQEIIEPIIISIMILTKQTLGLLIIPNLIYSKNKKKTLIIYIISLSILLIYLLINNNLYQFIDYCILGMFDFTSKNGSITPLLLIEIPIIITLLIIGITSKEKKYLYILAFQIIVLPTTNYIHFLIGFIPVIYLLLLHFKKSFIGSIFLTSFSVSFTIIFIISIYKSYNNYQFLTNYKENTFMNQRLTYTATQGYIEKIKINKEKYKDYKTYILGSFSYLIKLNLHEPLTKYDNINNGNMGYKGKDKYIKEINKICQQEKCLFIINDEEASGKLKNQTNTEILNYVTTNYQKEYSSNTFSIYKNK